MDEVRKFMEAMQNDPRAKELMDSMDVPVDEEKAVDVYLDLAKKLGFSISREELISWVQEKEEECMSRSERAEADMAEELDSEKMSMVAGGKGRENCFKSYLGKWCWYSDNCTKVNFLRDYH